MTDRGLYEKFAVSRIDERDRPGGDRQNAVYFVLDLTYDPHSRNALAAYARSCQDSHPTLAHDLYKIVNFYDEVHSHESS